MRRCRALLRSGRGRVGTQRPETRGHPRDEPGSVLAERHSTRRSRWARSSILYGRLLGEANCRRCAASSASGSATADGGTGSRATGDDPPAPSRPGRRGLSVGRHARQQRNRLRRRRHRPPARPAAHRAACRCAGCRQPCDLAFGFRRLAILDLSAAGHQPMSSPDGRFWLIFNGEVYNYLELRDELRGFGHGFRSGSDSEVVLAAFAQWGSECLARFNGMWALAIWDRVERSLFLARDRFGVKPLYSRGRRRHVPLRLGDQGTGGPAWAGVQAERGGDLRLSGRRAAARPAGRPDLLRRRAFAAAGSMADGSPGRFDRAALLGFVAGSRCRRCRSGRDSVALPRAVSSTPCGCGCAPTWRWVPA